MNSQNGAKSERSKRSPPEPSPPPLPQLTKGNSGVYIGSVYIYQHLQKKALNVEDMQRKGWIAVNLGGWSAQPAQCGATEHLASLKTQPILSPTPPWTLKTKRSEHCQNWPAREGSGEIAWEITFEYKNWSQACTMGFSCLFLQLVGSTRGSNCCCPSSLRACPSLL